MTTSEAPRRPSLFARATSVFLWALIATAVIGMIAIMAPTLYHWYVLRDAAPAPSLPTLPTAAVAPLSRPNTVPAPNLEQISATSTAIYHATAAAVDAPPANQNNTGDSAPLTVEQRPSEREPAGLIVPTAEPIAPAVDDGVFGSKPVIVAPQTTHECRHGQVWIAEKGCKNP